MQISFHGAARTVTGSKHILHLAPNKKILLDCGMFQGLGPDTIDMNNEWGFDPTEINYLLLSHAHIDHVGLLPKLYKDGFKGKVYCTAPTLDLALILMLDSAEIQEEDMYYINKKRAAQNRTPVEAMYDEADVRAVIKQFEIVPYDQEYKIDDQITVLYKDCGHIIGSASVHIIITENDKTTRLTFSGDIGRYRDVILRSPEQFPQSDIVVMECTYGNKLHEYVHPPIEELYHHINETCIENGGKLIIPAFSVGRTQELIFFLNRLETENRLPPVDYYVDSPLSVDATNIIKKHPECYNDSIKQLMETDHDVFSFKGLKYLKTLDQSKKLNGTKKPCVIIASSGMAEAGRVKHHIAQNIQNGRNRVLLVGYCEPRSLGGKLQNGDKEVFIFGKPFTVNATVASIGSMSAHGDYQDLLQWVSCQNPALIKKLFLVHGDYEIQQAFSEKLKEKGFENIAIPERHQLFEI